MPRVPRKRARFSRAPCVRAARRAFASAPSIYRRGAQSAPFRKFIVRAANPRRSVNPPRAPQTAARAQSSRRGAVHAPAPQAPAPGAKRARVSSIDGAPRRCAYFSKRLRSAIKSPHRRCIIVKCGKRYRRYRVSSLHENHGNFSAQAGNGPHHHDRHRNLRRLLVHEHGRREDAERRIPDSRRAHDARGREPRHRRQRRDGRARITHQHNRRNQEHELEQLRGALRHRRGVRARPRHRLRDRGRAQQGEPRARLSARRLRRA